LSFLDAHLQQGGRIDTLGVHAAMEATNAVRDKHGDGLASCLGGDALAKEMCAAAQHKQAYRGTTHISVIDAEGNAASVSLSNGEGNGAIVGPFGFMLNNMLGEEDVTPGDEWREGTRLSSMMAPTIIMEADGTVTALGTGGSNRIRTAVLQVAVNLLAHGMSLEDAVATPRLHVERSGVTSFEPGLSEEAEAAFRALGDRGHAWPEPNLFFGGVHAARRRGKGDVEGAGDPRRQGAARVV